MVDATLQLSKSSTSRDELNGYGDHRGKKA